jgi:hypothetical protein
VGRPCLEDLHLREKIILSGSVVARTPDQRTTHLYVELLGKVAIKGATGQTAPVAADHTVTTI